MSAIAEIEAIRVRKHAYQVQAERDIDVLLKLCDKFGLALMMIREGCADPADFARRILLQSSEAAPLTPQETRLRAVLDNHLREVLDNIFESGLLSEEQCDVLTAAISRVSEGVSRT